MSPMVIGKEKSLCGTMITHQNKQPHSMTAVVFNKTGLLLKPQAIESGENVLANSTVRSKSSGEIPHKPNRKRKSNSF